MFEKIIIGYDGSDQARDALAFGQALGETAGVKPLLVEVMPYEPLLSEISIGPPTTLSAQRDATREGLQTLARSLGLEAEAVESRSPARGLHDAAERLGADLIVVGSSHRGRVGRLLAGSVGRSLLRGSPCAVAIAPQGYGSRAERKPRAIGVGFDASPESLHALREAADLAARSGASLRVVSAVVPLGYAYGGAWVIADPDLQRVRREHLQRDLDDALRSLPDTPRSEARVVDGNPVRVLVDAADDGLDLLFLGSRGYGRLRGVLLGSVSADVVGGVQCPLVIVPRGAEGAPDPAGSAAATAMG